MLISIAGILLASLLSLSGQVAAQLPDGRLSGNNPPLPMIPKDPEFDPNRMARPKDMHGREIPPYNTTYYFDQLIDHNDPSKGTFKVRYWMTWEFYKPGGPMIMMTPGEGNGESTSLLHSISESIKNLWRTRAFLDYLTYITNQTINGLIAQQQGGATILVEHRFYGLSNPYPDLSVKSFQVHTLDQAIEDFDYFAKNVKLPFPGGDQVGPDRTPWIAVGGSYSGALAAWLRVAWVLF
jgi:hypothetical protein